MEKRGAFVLVGADRERKRIMVVSRGHAKWLGAALAASVLVTMPALGASTRPAKRNAPRIMLTAPGSLGSFTPAAADPRLAAAFARSGLAGGDFHFTPASTPGSRRRAVTVAVRARANTKAEAERSAALTPTEATPTAYNLGVAVGWKRFAISGDIARIDAGIQPWGREAADVALSYSGRRWTTRLQLGADRSSGTRPPMLAADQAYSVDIGGTYALTRNLELSGGMRYRTERDGFAQMNDERRDSQAVYVGTAFKF